MKKLFGITLLALSLPVLADMEHKTGQGVGPSAKELSASRSCFQEIAEEGCGHPIEDQEFFNTCLAEKMEELTPSCQKFFGRLYGRRK